MIKPYNDKQLVIKALRSKTKQLSIAKINIQLINMLFLLELKQTIIKKH